MPYKSDAQRRYLHAKHPALARKWDKEYGGKVSKASQSQIDNARLRRAKKANVATSTASGVLGVGALGALAASRARPGRFMAPARAAQLRRAGEGATVPLSAASLGVGGVGSLNFARVQNQEANRLPKFDRKTGRIVMPKQKVAKAFNPRAAAGAAKARLRPTAEQRYNKLAQKRQPDYRKMMLGNPTNVAGTKYQSGHLSEGFEGRSNWAWKGSETTRNRMAVGRVGGSAMQQAGGATYAHRPGQLTRQGRSAVKATGASAAAGGAAYGVNRHNYKQREQTVTKSVGLDLGLSSVHQGEGNIETVAKRKDWQNISEHQRRARDSRRTQRAGGNIAGLGGAAVTGAAALAATRGRSAGTQTVNVARGLNTAGRHFVAGTKQMKKNPNLGRNLQNLAGREVRNTVQANPFGAGVVGGAGLMGIGGATTAAGLVNEKKHNRAIARQRKARVKKSLVAKPVVDVVGKAYDPEGNRKKRLDRYSTGLAAGAGAAGAASVPFGREAARGAAAWRSGRSRYGQAAADLMSGTGNVGSNRTKAAAGRRAWTSGRSAALKSGGKAGALGATALGLAVGADQVNRYKRNGGRSYNTRNW